MADLLFVEIEEVVAQIRRARLAALRAALADAGVFASNADEAAEDGSADQAWVRTILRRHEHRVDDVTVDMIVARAARDFGDRLGRGITLDTGARHFLESAASRARLAVVTRLDRTIADRVLGMSGIADLFDVVVTADDVVEPKPSPRSYQEAVDRQVRRLGAAGRMLAIEGSRAGIRAARAARIPVVAVGGLSADQAMEADAFVASLDGQTVDGLAALAAGRAGASS
jgi:HAD superfamily hydrolase (TIGR01509 family)